MELDNEKVLCLTHKGDLDGLASAALVTRVYGGEVVPVGYDDMLEALEPQSGLRLFITDLALSGRAFEKIVNCFNNFREVFVIDHHPLTKIQKETLRRMAVNLVHDVSDCSTVLTYDFLKPRLPFEAARLAACAAITDYMEDGPMASQLLERFERITLFQEASLYALAIIWRENSREGLMDIVSQLRNFRRPHRNGQIVRDALQALRRLDRVRRHIMFHTRKGQNIAIVETQDNATGTVATLALEVVECPVTMAYKVKDDVAKISCRSITSHRIHLGKLVAEAADKGEGTGGGHRHAAGARIPLTNLERFITFMEKKLSS